MQTDVTDAFGRAHSNLLSHIAFFLFLSLPSCRSSAALDMVTAFLRHQGRAASQGVENVF
jgi:hypothetical protein